MKRVVQLGDLSLDVTIKRDGDRLAARVGDREYALDVREAQTGVYSFLQAEEGGRSTEVVVQEREGTYRIRLRNSYYEARVERPGERLVGLSRGDQDGPTTLKAVMPGRVVRVVASPGEKVERGQGVLVIEAMKMENEIGSPKAGTVKEIHVSAGDRVEGGTPLAVIE